MGKVVLAMVTKIFVSIAVIATFSPCGVFAGFCRERVAVLGWHLSQEKFVRDGWRSDGPLMPIEFSRLTFYGQVKLAPVLHSGTPGSIVFWKPLRENEYAVDLVESQLRHVDISDLAALSGLMLDPEIESLKSWLQWHGFTKAIFSAKIPQWDAESLSSLFAGSAYPSQVQEFLPYSPNAVLRFLNYANRIDWNPVLREIQRAPVQLNTPARRILKQRRGL